METCKRWEKQIWNAVSVCRVWDFVGWSYFCGLGFPRSGQRRDTWYPLGVYPNTHLAIPQCKSLGAALGASSPYFKWDEDDRWETVSNADVCRNVQSCFKQTPWKLVDSGSWKFGKITCDMVVQFDCLGFMVSCLSSLCCHCPMMINDGDKETLSHKTIHLCGHPWPMKGPSFLCTSLQLSCC